MTSKSEATPITGSSFYEHITTLDRSNERFSLQVSVAFDILEIKADDLPILYDPNESADQAHSGYGPREEWLMRWLLKRFNAAEVQGDSPCLESRAWLLLRLLIARLPKTITARMLSTHKFTTILEKALRWMQDNIQANALSHDFHSQESQVLSDSSSSATIQTSSTPLVQKSKKRKRDHEEIETLKVLTPISFDFERLYRCISSASQEIHSQTIDLSEGVEGFAVEHMKAVIKCTPDRAAAILCSSLLVTRHVLEGWGLNDRYEEANSQPSAILPMISFWDMRSTNTDDLSGQSSHVAFSNKCLVPALQLILTCRATLYIESGNVALELEKLIAIHVILPTRAAFLKAERSKEPISKDARTVFEELFKPPILVASIDTHNLDESQKSNIIPSIPLLFEIALKCFPLKTSKQRSAEAPWLQALLFQLTRCTTMSLTVASSSFKQASRDMLKTMLCLVISKKIMISISMLELLLSELFSFGDETPEDSIDWSLVGLCLQIDESLGLSLGAEVKSSERSSPHQPSQVMAKILSRITTEGFRFIPTNEGPLNLSPEPAPYDLILNQILLPVLKAFVHVRDLNTFIKIWEHQVLSWQDSRPLAVSTRPDSKFVESVWQDERLLEAVSAKLELSFTTGQIFKIIESVFAAMRLSIDPLTENEARLNANATIMDSLLNGLKSENVILEVGELAKQLCRHISAVLCGTKIISQEYSWRLWRILASVVSRWPDLSQIFETRSQYYDVVNKAQQLVEQALLLSTHSQNNVYNHRTAIHAFRLILALALTRGEIEVGYVHDEVIPSITNCVVESMKITVEHSHKYYQGEHDAALGWKGSKGMYSLDTSDRLSLVCAAQVILAPKHLSNLDETLTEQFITWLYWCSCSEVGTAQKWNLNQEQSFDSLCFLWLWQELLKCSLHTSEATLLRCLCRVQVIVLDEGEIQSLPDSVNHYHRFSIGSLLRMPIDGFERQERAKIANIVLSRVLRIGETMEVEVIRNHVNLLIKCMELPNKAMDLASDPSCLWRVAKVLDNLTENTEVEIISLLRAFRQLITTTINHIIAESKQINNERAVTELNQAIDSHIRSCTSADLSLAVSIMISSSVQNLWVHREYLSDAFQQCTPTIADLRHKNFQRMLDSLIGFRMRQPAVWRVGILFEDLMPYSDLLQSLKLGADVRSNLQFCVDDITAHYTSQRTSSRSRDSLWIQYVEDSLLLAKKIASCLQMSESGVKTIATLDGLMDLHSKRAKHDLLRQFEASFLNLDIPGQVDFLSLLVQCEGESISREFDLIQIQRILLCQTDISWESEGMNAVLMRCFSALCDHLGQSTTPRLCILRMHCIDMMLRKLPGLILQWHVDNLLSAITIMTSSSGPEAACESAGNIFLGLCRLFSSLLAVHRSKLGGRYHLVVLGLQGLLRCLFEPYVQTIGKGAILMRPPWLDYHKVRLNEDHVAAYSRLLTAICDPTVSAVIRSKNKGRQELNDETKRARSIAGQHLQYVIMEFCQYQLQGHMSPEMRAALNPGLYAIFDAMSQNILRTINCALDSSGRAMFKVVYDDYRRFGRWHGG